MKSKKQQLSLLFLIIWSISQTTVGQGSFDLPQFNSCSFVTPVPNIAEDLSGVCYNYDTGTLFVVVDDGSIHELSLSGSYIREIFYGPGISDLEGIAYLGNNTYAIAVEDINFIDVITIQDAPNNTAGFVKFIDSTIPFGFDGIEGIAYNVAGDELFVVSEKNDMQIRKISDPNSANPIITTPFDLQAKAMTYASPITDAAGLSYTSSGTLLILSQESNIVVEVDPITGDLIGSSVLFPEMNHPEGIITISEQFIVVVGEDSEFQTFLRSGISCPPATTLPVITAHPQNSSVCNGSSTTFSMSASNADLYQWEQNSGGGFMPLANAAPFSGTNTMTLSIADVTGLDASQYRCVVTNAMGSVISNSATLTELDCGFFDLALRMTEQSSGPYLPGDMVTFEIEVINQGTESANSISVDDYLPNGLTLLDANWTQVGGTASLNTPIASIAPGITHTVTITCVVDPAFTGTSLVNDAEISTDNGDDIDSTPGDNATPNDLANDNNVNDPSGGDDQDPVEIMLIPCNDSSDPDQDGLVTCIDLCPADRDGALNFDSDEDAGGNTSDYIEVPHDPVLNVTSGDFAFEAWVNPSNGDYKTIVSKGHGGSAATEYIFQIIADDDPFFSEPAKLGLFLANGQTAQWRFSDSSIPQNTWTHVAVSVDRIPGSVESFVTFIVNGTEELPPQSFTLGDLYNADTNPLYIGRQGWNCNCNFFDGAIDELAIWNRTVTAAEMAASMAAPYSGTEPGLVAYYDFNDADACVLNNGNTTLFDKANGHNGSLQNFDLAPGCVSNWTSGHNMGSCPAPACPPSLDLTANQSSNAVYVSGSYISSDQVILLPAQVDYDAATEIDLLEGFEVQVGATLHAFIGGCD